MAYTAPKAIWHREPIFTGLEGSGTYVERYSYEALLLSESHYRLRNRRWSGGGPFYAYRRITDHTGIRGLKYRANGTIGKYAVFGVSPGSTRMPPVPDMAIPSPLAALSDARQYHATGYKKARPGNPVASLGQFLVELRDLPQVPYLGKIAERFSGVAFQSIPKILLATLQDFRNHGSEYLNAVFGWKPFVNDLRQVYNLMKTIDARMAKLKKENGQSLRRKATISNTVSTTQGYNLYGFPFANCYGSPPNYTSGSTVYKSTSTTGERIWFSAAFRYWIPDTDSWQWNARARAALFGALPTPELLWNVLPWTWLVDWFTNFGDVISNISPNAVDNLVTGYSFVMKHNWKHTVHSAEVSVNGLDNWNPNTGLGYTVKPLSTTIATQELIETKVRTGGGNPFTPYTTLPSLTAGQLGILAALGISRSAVR